MKRWLLVAATLALTGCTGPLLRFSTDEPAVVLTPVRYAGIRDARATFRSAFCTALQRDRSFAGTNCSDWLHRLSDEASVPADSDLQFQVPTFDLLFVPGIFGECVQQTVTLFGDAIVHLEHLGYRSATIPVRGRASSEHNAKIIRDHVIAHAREYSRRVLLVAYSKGVPDALVAINQYPEIQQFVAGLVSVAGVVGGTPIADSLQEFYERLIGPLPHDACPVIDGREIQSLTRRERTAWLTSHSLPTSIHFFSLVAMPDPDRVSAILVPLQARLASVDPRNDSQVIIHDAVIPNSALLGYANADHWAIALPFDTQAPLLAETAVTRNRFPRGPLIEAAVRTAEKEIKKSRLEILPGLR